MNIEKIIENKKVFLELLLLADEKESMIDKYLDRGDMFALYDDGSARAVCVVTKEGEGVFEIKNLAVDAAYHRQGYGRTMISHVVDYYRGCGRELLLGTGETDSILRFYQSCGFEYSHTVANFFVDNYDHEMFEDGKQLIDMIYLRKSLF